MADINWERESTRAEQAPHAGRKWRAHSRAWRVFPQPRVLPIRFTGLRQWHNSVFWVICTRWFGIYTLFLKVWSDFYGWDTSSRIKTPVPKWKLGAEVESTCDLHSRGHFHWGQDVWVSGLLLHVFSKNRFWARIRSWLLHQQLRWWENASVVKW